MAEKIEQMEVEGEAKDKVSSSIWKDYSAVLFFFFLAVRLNYSWFLPSYYYAHYCDCWM